MTQCFNFHIMAESSCRFLSFTQVRVFPYLAIENKMKIGKYLTTHIQPFMRGNGKG